MRAAEIVLCAYYGVFLLAAAFVPLDGRKRRNAIGIGVFGILLEGLLPLIDLQPGGRVFRDFIPSFLLLTTYWQAGQFVVVSDDRFQRFLSRFDRRWFPRAMALSEVVHRYRALWLYLHASYLACYPMVPLGVGALYLAGYPEAVATFWLVVLPPTLACQGLTTVFRSWPPWMASGPAGGTVPTVAVQSLNQWVTDHASIRANTFPSGHVAAAVAVALILLEVAPVAGVAFLFIAASVAVATVLLRYHYTLDVVLGTAFAVASHAFLG